MEPHPLPRGFVKIRHHGLMAPSHVRTKLATARRLLGDAPPPPNPADPPTTRDFRDVLLDITGVDLRRCPRCGLPAIRRHPLPTAHVEPLDTS
jgi:hypothetical protein